ncbi:MAG: hypothetical protein M1812_000116 [Candelaria pacifica]|nr:MAG: hypothetical protein M1812_000116 [Candelaria pacifica]
MSSTLPRRNSTSKVNSTAEIRGCLMMFHNIPPVRGWQELKDFVKKVMGCESVTWVEILIDETTKRPNGQGYATLKNRVEAIDAYYHYHRLRRWDINPYLITLWEGRAHDSNIVISETVPVIVGQGRAAGICYRPFTLQCEPEEGIAIKSDAEFASLLKKYQEDVLSGTLTIETPIAGERRWRVSEQVYQYCDDALLSTPNVATIPLLRVSDAHHLGRTGEDNRKTQSYYGRKAVEAKTYQNLYMAKYPPYAFSTPQIASSYASSASIPEIVPINLMGPFTPWFAPINAVNYRSFNPMTESHSDAIGVSCDRSSKPLKSPLLNRDQGAYTTEALTVSIRNLPYEATSAHIHSMFKSTGLGCLAVDVRPDRRAVARFASEEEAGKAIKRHDGKEFMGRQISVREDNSKVAGSKAGIPYAASVHNIPKDGPPIIVDGSGASGARLKDSRGRSASVIIERSKGAGTGF